MAYHILISEDNSGGNLIFDHYLGSAKSVEHYWESVGEKLNLKMISLLTEKADSEEGFTICSNDLVEFKVELLKLEEYWAKEDEEQELPENFVENLQLILEAVDKAIAKGLKLMIG